MSDTNVKHAAARWTVNTSGGEWTLWLNDGDVDRMRGRFYKIGSCWTGLYVSPEDRRKFRLAEEFEAPEHTRHALTEAVLEGPTSAIWSRPDKVVKRRGRRASAIGANVLPGQGR